MHYQLDQPISSALQLCALLEGVVRGTPSVPPALRSPVATRAAMRRLLYGRPVPLSSFEVTALRPTFADVTKTGTHVKCGFNCGFPFRDQKKWKLTASQRKETRESGCSKTFAASHGSTYGTLVALCSCGCVAGHSTVMKAEGRLARVCTTTVAPNDNSYHSYHYSVKCVRSQSLGRGRSPSTRSGRAM